GGQLPVVGHPPLAHDQPSGKNTARTCGRCLQPAQPFECGRGRWRLRHVQSVWRAAAPPVQGRGQPRHPGRSGRRLPGGRSAGPESPFRYSQNDVQSAAAAILGEAVVLIWVWNFLATKGTKITKCFVLFVPFGAIPFLVAVSNV